MFFTFFLPKKSNFPLNYNSRKKNNLYWPILLTCTSSTLNNMESIWLYLPMLALSCVTTKRVPCGRLSDTLTIILMQGSHSSSGGGEQWGSWGCLGGWERGRLKRGFMMHSSGGGELQGRQGCLGRQKCLGSQILPSSGESTNSSSLLQILMITYELFLLDFWSIYLS